MTAWIKRGTEEHVGIVADDFVDPESVYTVLSNAVLHLYIQITNS